MSELNNAAVTRFASAAIQPAVFVADDPTSDRHVLTCGAGGVAVGISEAGSATWPQIGAGAQPAAPAGAQLVVYQSGATDVLLTIGAGGWTPNALIKSDANGLGIQTTTTNDKYYAKATESGPAGGLGRVQLIRGTV